MNPTAIVPVPVGYADRGDAALASVAGRSAIGRIADALRPVADVVLAVAPTMAHAVLEAVATQHIPDVRVVTAEAPGWRVQCLDAGLADSGGGLVLVADLAWTVFGPDLLSRVQGALAGGAVAVVPTTAVTDSVKRVDVRGCVTDTVDRSRLRTMQYPRGFDATALKALTAGAAEPFDEVIAAVHAGLRVTQVDGDDAARRVELPVDGAYLTAVLQARPGR